jgi:inosose dehydratase
MSLNRRSFSKALALSVGAAALPQLRSAGSKIKIGYTCITWGVNPRRPEALDPALKDISSLGFWAFETYAEDVEALDAKDQMKGLLDKYGVPLNAGYLSVNVTDPTVQKDVLPQVIRLAKVLKKYGADYFVLQVNGVKRAEYNFQDHRANIISTLNDCGKAITDVGLATGLHQHTGTAVETRDEVYSIMEGVDTRHMKFAPDVGQLQRGGADAAKVVKDFLPIITHMHLKDFDGTRYCPLGQGKVDVASVLEMVEGAHLNPSLNVELDSSKPATPLEAGQVSKSYLQKLGYAFRS